MYSIGKIPGNARENGVSFQLNDSSLRQNRRSSVSIILLFTAVITFFSLAAGAQILAGRVTDRRDEIYRIYGIWMEVRFDISELGDSPIDRKRLIHVLDALTQITTVLAWIEDPNVPIADGGPFPWMQKYSMSQTGLTRGTLASLAAVLRNALAANEGVSDHSPVSIRRLDQFTVVAHAVDLSLSRLAIEFDEYLKRQLVTLWRAYTGFIIFAVILTMLLFFLLLLRRRDVLVDERTLKLTRDLIRAHETERSVTSRELHDTVAQDLAFVKMEIDVLDEWIKNTGGPAASEYSISQEIKRTLDRSITQVRQLSYRLQPPSLDEFGIEYTIRQYCTKFAKSAKITISFFSAGIERTALPYELQIYLYRLVQDILTYLHRERESESATLRLVSSHPILILRVAADTKVPVHEQDRFASRRLFHVGERARLLGGSMRIIRDTEGKLVIRIEIPNNVEVPDAKR